jgi:hypothetical protein
MQTADAIHLAAAVHWGCDALLTNDRAFQLIQTPMGLTLIEAAKYETRLEHLAVIKTFAEGDLLSDAPRHSASA